MKNFAVINNGEIENIIVAESKEIAESVTEKECIEFTLDNPAEVGGSWNGSIFIPKKDFPSWVYDSNTNQWNPPTSHPNDGNAYKWDEESLSWISY